MDKDLYMYKLLFKKRKTNIVAKIIAFDISFYLSIIHKGMIS